MKEKMKFKKMLALVGSLAIVVPTSLTVVACGSKETEAPKTELSEVVKTIEVDGNIANDAVKVLEEIEAKNLEVKGAIEIN
ncbi:hypothetical protein, partial [Spiroplasma platyhelix]